MTTPADPRETAFWLDTATLTLAALDVAVQSGDAQKLRAEIKVLVAVSCRYKPWDDPRAAETLAQIDARLRQYCANPENLRRAYRTSPNSPLWTSGEYAQLEQPAQ